MERVSAEDYIYVGSWLPLNHKYIDIETANSNSSVVSVEIWFDEEWVDALDEIDGAAVSGASFGQEGIIRWTTDREKGWTSELDSTDVTGLETAPLIYGFYWMRFKFSADFSASTAINYMGHNFANDDELYSYYPDLAQSNLMTAFASGKTNWNEQHFMAADVLIQDLRSKNIIKTADQILDFDLMRKPAIHKVASIIYQAFGKSYAEDRALAHNRYEESIQMAFLNIDVNNNARLDNIERHLRTGFLTR